MIPPRSILCRLILLVFLVFSSIAGCSNAVQPSPQATPTGSPLPSMTATIAIDPYDPPFPRLGMWWPNAWHQPLEDIARYNWVILGDYQAEFIDPLRAINPNLILLTDTNALELHYYPEDPTANREILKIPYSWFLTQAGSTLRADIDSTQTVIPVDAVRGQNGEKTIDLFRPGDAVLLENESLVVEEVDPGTLTLTVQRGFIRPASSHPAGARIAAHITTWPSTWMLNVSTLSPKAVEDPSIGPEIWPEYNARMGAALLEDPRWSGILVDRSETGQSRYIDGDQVRSIDPDQSNRLLEDYSAFDSTWSDGLRLYLQKLRQAVGPSRIIYLNWGIDEYPLVNGSNFEGFPDENGALGDNSWQAVVFGPYHRGSYFDWVTRSPQPNLTMIETYEDNSVPSGEYNNPCEKTRFRPNYRKMRFGLATALLNDGYFSYEMNTTGHGSLCLMWFDEYDNAGAGRGYLGYPRGQAVQVPAERLSTQQSGVNVWERQYDNGIVLLNATAKTVTITLDGQYRKIKGTQAPAVNNGRLVTKVAIPPMDGLILLRP